MNRLLLAALPLLASVGIAQAAGPNASEQPSNPAVSTSDANNGPQPVKGANSFTEDQAKSRIEAKGYSKVSTLTKDPDGIWRGTATKGAAVINVAVDFQGNVFGH